MEQKVKPVPIAVGEEVYFNARNRQYNCIDQIVGTVVKVNRVNMKIVENKYSAYSGREWTVWKNKVRRYRNGA